MAAGSRPESRSGLQRVSCYSAGARNDDDDDSPIRLNDHDISTVHDDVDLYHDHRSIR
jgi:hypothetical protein